MTDGYELGAGRGAAAGDKQYETKVVQAIRGTESRAEAKWRKEGWELVSQSPGTLRTELTFRRVKPKTFGSYLAQGYTAFLGLTPRTQKVVAASVGGLVLILITGGVVAATLGGDEGADRVATPSQAAAPTEDLAAPSTEEAAAPSTEAKETEDANTEDRAAPSATEPEESTASETTADEDEPAAQSVTTDNNEEFAALLEVTDYCGESVGAFADEYAERTVEFDASIGAMNNHGSATTRYDILLTAGEYSESVAAGPVFQFRDVNMGDLNLTGDVPDTIGVGQELHVVATVDRFEESSCLLLLDPMSTEVQ